MKIVLARPALQVGGYEIPAWLAIQLNKREIAVLKRAVGIMETMRALENEIDPAIGEHTNSAEDDGENAIYCALAAGYMEEAIERGTL